MAWFLEGRGILVVKEGERFKDIKAKKVCIVKGVTEDNTVILQCVDGLSETFVSQKDLNRFFERIDSQIPDS